MVVRGLRPDTCERLGEGRLAWLREQPTELWIDAIAVVHAAPGDLWQAPVTDADDQEFEAAYGPLRAGAVVYGHVHRPFSRTVTGMAIANAGSAGMSWDGDNRALYLLVDDGQAEVIRVAYDVEAEARELLARGHPDAERLIEMRRLGLVRCTHHSRDQAAARRRWSSEIPLSLKGYVNPRRLEKQKRSWATCAISAYSETVGAGFRMSARPRMQDRRVGVAVVTCCRSFELFVRGGEFGQFAVRVRYSQVAARRENRQECQ